METQINGSEVTASQVGAAVDPNNQQDTVVNGPGNGVNESGGGDDDDIEDDDDEE